MLNDDVCSRHALKTHDATALVLAPQMLALRSTLERVAPTQLPLLILGETGSGKELMADWVHTLSRRRQHAFSRINCASLSAAVIETELFGHEKGAFTGAVNSRPGLFEAAHSGALFLDEIGELSPRTQAKLLRVLECGEIVRVGSVTPQRVDVRFLAATHRDLPTLVAQRTFREDLYFRLNGA